MKKILRLLPFIENGKKNFIKLLIISAAADICLLSAPRLIGLFVDELIAGNVNNLYLVTILALYIIAFTLFRYTAKTSVSLSASASHNLRKAAFEKLCRLPVSYFDKTKRGNIQNIFTYDIEAVGEGISHGLNQLISGIAAIIISFVFMVILSPVVALVALVVAPVCYFVSRIIAKSGVKKYKKQSELLAKLNSLTEETIDGAETLKIFGCESQKFNEFEKINNELYQTGRRAQFNSALINPSNRLVNNSSYAAVGVIALLSGCGAGTVTAFLMYMSQFSKPFGEISSLASQLQTAFACSERLFAFLGTDEQSIQEAHKTISDFKGEICFKNICFSYEPQRKLIENFNLTIPAGTNTAIVGRTGSGKTTLINLLMRFYEPQSGVITVDGIDISQMDREYLREMFGMVLQDTALFERSVRDNIAFSNPSASENDIISAATASGADSFIKKMPRGYDTVLDSERSNISAGQKQLIAISRIMLKDSKMLILDEATSNVDIVTENKISSSFLKLMKGKTSFIIAHRLSTIRHCDLIIVIDNGNIAEIGTHEQLLQNKSVYYNLYNADKLSQKAE